MFGETVCVETKVGLNLEVWIIPFSTQAILFLMYWSIFIYASTFQTYEVQISGQTCSLVSFTFKLPLSKGIKKSTVLIFQFAFPMSIQEFTSLSVCTGCCASLVEQSQNLIFIQREKSKEDFMIIIDLNIKYKSKKS